MNRSVLVEEKQKAYLSTRRTVISSTFVVRLVRAHCDLGVSGAFHGPLVYVGRSDDDVLVVDDHPFGVHIYHEPPELLSRLLDRGFQEQKNTASYLAVSQFQCIFQRQ